MDIRLLLGLNLKGPPCKRNLLFAATLSCLLIFLEVAPTFSLSPSVSLGAKSASVHEIGLNVQEREVSIWVDALKILFKKTKYLGLESESWGLAEIGHLSGGSWEKVADNNNNGYIFYYWDNAEGWVKPICTSLAIVQDDSTTKMIKFSTSFTWKGKAASASWTVTASADKSYLTIEETLVLSESIGVWFAISSPMLKFIPWNNVTKGLCAQRQVWQRQVFEDWPLLGSPVMAVLRSMIAYIVVYDPVSWLQYHGEVYPFGCMGLKAYDFNSYEVNGPRIIDFHVLPLKGAKNLEYKVKIYFEAKRLDGEDWSLLGKAAFESIIEKLGRAPVRKPFRSFPYYYETALKRLENRPRSDFIDWSWGYRRLVDENVGEAYMTVNDAETLIRWGLILENYTMVSDGRRLLRTLLNYVDPKTGLIYSNYDLGKKAYVDQSGHTGYYGTWRGVAYPVFGLLQFYDFFHDPEVLNAAVNALDKMILLQNEDGSWWWLYTDALAGAPYQGSKSVTGVAAIGLLSHSLLRVYEMRQDAKYLSSAIRALNYVKLNEYYAHGAWEADPPLEQWFVCIASLIAAYGKAYEVTRDSAYLEECRKWGWLYLLDRYMYEMNWTLPTSYMGYAFGDYIVPAEEAVSAWICMPYLLKYLLNSDLLYITWAVINGMSWYYKDFTETSRDICWYTRPLYDVEAESTWRDQYSVLARLLLASQAYVSADTEDVLVYAYDYLTPNSTQREAIVYNPQNSEVSFNLTVKGLRKDATYQIYIDDEAFLTLSGEVNFELSLGPDRYVKVFVKAVEVKEPADNTPPQINNIQSPIEVAYGEAVTIKADVTDDTGVAAVILYYSVDGGSIWSSVKMMKLVTDTYLAEIPTSKIPPGTTVIYRIYAFDKALNEALSSGSLTITWPYLQIVLIAVSVSVIIAVVIKLVGMHRRHPLP